MRDNERRRTSDRELARIYRQVRKEENVSLNGTRGQQEVSIRESSLDSQHF